MRFENTWNGRRKRLSDGILAMTRDSISRKVSKPVGKAESLGNANYWQATFGKWRIE